MTLKNSPWKTIVACIPAFASGALSPIISDTVLRIAFFLSWVLCVASHYYNENPSTYVATFIKGEYRKGVAGVGVVFWSTMFVLLAGGLGALVASKIW